MVDAGLRGAAQVQGWPGLCWSSSSWLCGETLFNLFALLKKVPEFSLVTLIPQLGPDMSQAELQGHTGEILKEFRKLLKNHSFCAVASLSL